MLEITDIRVAYRHLNVLWDVSLHVDDGEIVVLLGANGAGKTTTMKTAQGLLRPSQGTVSFMGKNVHDLASHHVVARGLVLVPESRMLFPDMSVVENLELGAFTAAARKHRQTTQQWVFQLFPRLQNRLQQKAKTLSGGEQQMLAIGRALMARPKLLMLDEPSLGLAPIVVTEVFRTIRVINAEGISILLVEQNVRKSLELARRAYIIETGRITRRATGKELLDDAQVRQAYLGM